MSLRPKGAGEMLPLLWPVFKQAKQDKHAQTCAGHLDFLPFGFPVLSSFGPAADELLDRVCRRYRIHARVAEWEVHAWVHRVHEEHGLGRGDSIRL